MTTRDDWRRSSRSGTNGDCVEVHATLRRLRDSKDRSGSELTVSGFPVFVDMMKADRIGP